MPGKLASAAALLCIAIFIGIALLSTEYPWKWLGRRTRPANASYYIATASSNPCAAVRWGAYGYGKLHP